MLLIDDLNNLAFFARVVEFGSKFRQQPPCFQFITPTSLEKANNWPYT